MSFKELLFLRLSIYIPVSRFAMDNPCRDDSIHPVYSGLFYSESQYLSYPGFLPAFAESRQLQLADE
jgi:hypothetical protein